jgi:predicted nucleic acid-binding protein
MKIYLDNCSLQRPLDSRSQIRITLEAEAVLGILTLCEAGEIELVSSEALIFEISQNPNPTRRKYAMEVLAYAKSFVAVNDEIETKSRDFINRGVRPLDALHLACAESLQADFFCTTDDKLLKRVKTFKDLQVKVVSPTEFIEEIEK